MVLFFCFKNYGYCSSAEGQYQLVNPNNDFIDDTTGEITGTIQYDNQFLSVKAIQEEIQRAFILRMYAIYSRDEDSAVTYARNILNQLYNGATSDNVGLYIQMAGSESQFRINYYRHKQLSDAVGYGVYSYNNMMFGNVPYQYTTCPRDVIDNDGNIVFSNAAAEIRIPVPMIGVFVPEFLTMFRDFGLINSAEQNTLTAIQQQNNLINEQNQIQQEQNDILTNDDVETDGLEFATDDTVNPTSDGFNTLFNTVYNAFCNTSSEPLTITLPYINKSFTIQPNLVSNAMQKCGLGFITTLIHSFYYYSVCIFIYKDINKIIEHLKSGNLTADCGNVKTEVL